MKKILMLLIFAFGLTTVASAQQDDAHTFVFRFNNGYDMFQLYNPDNKDEIDEMHQVIAAEYLELLKEANCYIYVASYGTSAGEGRSAKAVAHVRRNRVKSELIVNSGLKEAMFATDRFYAEPYGADKLYNVVVVTIPAPIEKVREILGDVAADKVQAYYDELNGAAAAAEAKAKAEAEAKAKAEAEAKAKAEAEAKAKAEAEEEARRKAAEEEEARRKAAEEAAALASKERVSVFNIRTNLLYWAGGMMNAGFEYKGANSRVGILVNGGYSFFGNTNWDRNMGGWFVSPEVRIYLGEKQRWFVGAQAIYGGLNVKFSDVGYQGHVLAGGVVGGYKMTISKLLDLDFSLGLGYGNLNYDTYEHHSLDNVNTYIEQDITKNTIMPIQAGVSLIFKL